MSIDFYNKRPPEGPVLQIESITVPQRDEFDVSLDSVSLTMKRGELAVLLLKQGVSDYPLPDVISGLVPVEQGTVRVFGEEWKNLSADQQAMARWRIGRVFTGRGWMSNLDVDENVTLSERHHTLRSLTEIADESERLARLVGLNELPQGRPAIVDRSDLRRAEWVRAGMGSPWLIVLERPGRDLPGNWIGQLNKLVQERREQGTAVLWLCEAEAEWNDKTLNPSLKLRAEENKLLVES